MADPRATVISIGWDVGGWRGTKQGVAVVSASRSSAPRWCGPARTTTAAELLANGLDELLRDTALGPAATVLREHRVVLAIDAPLGFPRAFRQLVASAWGANVDAIADAEIDDPFAYRECDRYIASKYGKRPLSASFDRLGNNATVAQALLARWRSELGLRVLPFDEHDPDRPVAIEVYPALSKEQPRTRARSASRPWADHFPSPPPSLGSDEYDACLCALLGLAFDPLGIELGLPRLVDPPTALQSSARNEGWIFAPPS